MFRLLRLRRLLPFSARVRNTSAPQADVIRVQRVRFRKKRFKISDVLVIAGLSYAFYEIVTRALIVLVKEVDIELTEEELQELEDEEAEPLFIPFPGFTQTVEPVPFRSSDPEWREYIKVSRNQALLSSIRTNLAEMARRAVANDRQLTSRCGKDATVSRFWLDVQYPLKPPPTFVRQGLAFGGGDGITWTTQPVDSTAVFWTRQALWPSALTSSLWSFTNALVLQNATTIARFFGYESQQDSLSNMQQTMEKLLQLNKQARKPSSDSPPFPSQDRTSEGSATSPLPSMDKRAAGSTTTPETLGTGTSVDSSVPTVSSAKVYMTRTAQEHTSGPWDKFKKNLAQKWRRPPAYPPRGSICVSGLVEVVTQRTVLTVDCIAWWDPQTKNYDPRTVYLGLRAIRPKVQAPLR
ncbi:hypothetical protein F5B22DRAFT_636081 [Xylaria bambusicola]|uniref:uncharacterized protein n=1 Tax=Xylaria bambusicola TaxID=326684 RepID=UPI002008E125|nr:uncharacterized protein F5B22DRAFT_636081 [Xylaria bambusicola]KAI0517162.1 hypothetical protein F5B22DRAFT_636081 [Xylaria bambusicola]